MPKRWEGGRRGWGSWPMASVGCSGVWSYCLCPRLEHTCNPIFIQLVCIFQKAKWSRFFSVTCRVIVQRGMLPLPWLPPGVWHRSPGSTLALHGGEHPAPFYRTASECRHYRCLSCRWGTYTKSILRPNQETRRQNFLFVCLYNSLFPLFENCNVAWAVETRYEGAFWQELCIEADLGIWIRFQGDVTRSKHGEGKEQNKNPHFSEVLKSVWPNREEATRDWRKLDSK
jgi:hypothetical protein